MRKKSGNTKQGKRTSARKEEEERSSVKDQEDRRIFKEQCFDKFDRKTLSELESEGQDVPEETVSKLTCAMKVVLGMGDDLDRGGDKHIDTLQDGLQCVETLSNHHPGLQDSPPLGVTSVLVWAIYS